MHIYVLFFSFFFAGTGAAVGSSDAELKLAPCLRGLWGRVVSRRGRFPPSSFISLSFLFYLFSVILLRQLIRVCQLTYHPDRCQGGGDGDGSGDDDDD